ncbi:FAD-binding oxidoreductase [Occultella glacieicola]|uniref:FAD-binding oxidoreductase n=1 Tax=Occultella glacieicola TaxID=2518684 RepID=A0ABY2DX55_9MICO|nr:FAD-binding oxidoreductase [Occultella glacieicola]TDE88549.1 FAD-binding oxidoreductase [Occultella glacieicola]
MKLTSYWLDTATPAGDFRRSELPKRVDVAVVGAGLTGLSTALHLARDGASVALLEARTVGWGASGRNGGMATTGLAVGYGTAARRYGRPRAAAMFAAYNDAIDTVEKLVADEGIDCNFERVGKLTLAAKTSHYEGFGRTAEMLAEDVGQELMLVPASELRKEIGSDFYRGGMVDPLGAGVHVGKLVAGLARAGSRAGVSIHEACEVYELRRLNGRRYDVLTSRGTIRADRVVVGTSGYSGRMLPWLQRRLVPIGSFVLVTEPLADEVVDGLLPQRRVAADTNRVCLYFRLTPDKRLLFGGRARFSASDRDADLTSGRILHRQLLQVFPQLTNTRIDYCWGGLVDMSLDQMVHAGERDGVLYSVGYSGHGVQMATHMGKVMAQMANGVGSANPWRDLRFPPVPGYFGTPWFLPPAGVLFKFLDRVS